MTGVVDRLVVAMNAHDLDAAAGLFHRDYRSEQPAHPAPGFVGPAQMRANWQAMFAGIPTSIAELCRSIEHGDTTWSEWRLVGHPDRRAAVRGARDHAVRGQRRSHRPVGRIWKTSSGTIPGLSK